MLDDVREATVRLGHEQAETELDDVAGWSGAAEEEEVVVDEDGVSWPASYTAAERQAVLDVAAANAEPVYDSLEETYDFEDEAEEEE
jgi:hypothetical protein